MSDLINRNDIYKLFEHGVAKLHVSDIDAISTVDAEPVVHGHWIDAEVCGIDMPTVRCSVCSIRFCDLINNHRYMYRYCPHCGAKMDEVNE